MKRFTLDIYIITLNLLKTNNIPRVVLYDSRLIS